MQIDVLIKVKIEGRLENELEMTHPLYNCKTAADIRMTSLIRNEGTAIY